MRLQIRKITGPDAINDGFSTDFTQTGNENLYTCYFNRPVNDTDQFPLNVTIRKYSNRGTLLETETLNLARDQVLGDPVRIPGIITKFYFFRFRVTVPVALTGTSMYIHVVIDYQGSENVSFSTSSYHETIKHIQLNRLKAINYVYWSYNEEALTVDSIESSRIIINSNEDLFLHIKTQGMYSDNVEITIFGGGENRELNRIIRPLHRNKRVIAISIRDIIARYESVTGSPPSFPLMLSARVASVRDRILHRSTGDLHIYGYMEWKPQHRLAKAQPARFILMSIQEREMPLPLPGSEISRLE